MRPAWLRWVLVAVPTLCIVVFDYVRHVVYPELLLAWPGSVLFVALVVVGATVISHAVFGLFERHRRSFLWLVGELTALGAIATERSSTKLNVLEAIVDRVLRSLPADAGAIYLLDRTDSSLRRSVALNHTPATPALPERIDAEDASVSRALRSGASALCECASPLRGLGEAKGLVALVPLRSRDTVLGLMVLAGCHRPAVRDNLDLLAVIGSYVGVIVDNLRLFEESQRLLHQSRHLAVLEERDRLAREMHDSLAQALGLVAIGARVIQELLRRSEYARAADQAEALGEAADAAYADVREAILGLRGSVRFRGLIASLREYLQQFGRQSGIATKLVVHPDAVTRFTPAVETQLIRVIQEALTNVRKHARATTAVVSFEADEGWARIVVEDDGQGFDPVRVRQAGDQGFGLQTMSERVEGVGGTLEVVSESGRGTRVIARLPLGSEGEGVLGRDAKAAVGGLPE